MADKSKRESSKSILTIIILIAVGILLAWGLLGTNMKAEEDFLKISGLHAQKIQYSEIRSLELTDELPIITAKTGGFSLAGKRLGNFTTAEYGRIKLYLFNNASPFIFIEKDDGSIIILNMKDSTATEDFYNELMDKTL